MPHLTTGKSPSCGTSDFELFKLDCCALVIQVYQKKWQSPKIGLFDLWKAHNAENKITWADQSA